jgi:DNA-binding response OmpR family regulator
VRKLREKIEVDASNPHWIETVWGLGYRFRKDG